MPASATPTRSRGRPPKADAKRRILSLRARQELREAIGRRAAANQRSISEEIEAVIESAIVGATTLDQALDVGRGRQRAGLLLLLDLVIGEVAMRSNLADRPAPAPLDDPWTYSQIEAAVVRVMRALRPEGLVQPPPALQEMERKMPGLVKVYGQVGETLAVQTLMAIAGAEGEEWLRDRGQPIADRLGEAIVQRLAQETGTRAPGSKPRASTKE